MPTKSSTAAKVGFLADTHSSKPDGSDLPDPVLAAFKGVDLIVHLGDVGRKGILERLSAIAPVLVPAGDGKGYVDSAAPGAPTKVIDAGGVRVGVTFNIANPDKEITAGDEGLSFAAPVDELVQRRFRESVSVVAFGGTHRPLVAEHDGVLFFNPGSPTLPMDGAGTVAVLRIARGKPAVEVVSIT